LRSWSCPSGRWRYPVATDPDSGSETNLAKSINFLPTQRIRTHQIFANASHDFVTVASDPWNYVDAARNVAVVAVVGAAITSGFGSVSFLGESAELIAFNTALAGSGSTAIAASTTLAATAGAGSTAIVTAGMTAITLPAASVVGGGSLLSSALPIAGQSIAVGAGAAALNALSDGGQPLLQTSPLAHDEFGRRLQTARY
jgi:Zn-dependent alcohol dehydrogenase